MSDIRPTDLEVRDCRDGCADDDHKHAWEIEPSPQSDFDVFVCDTDDGARNALERVVEMVWDEIGPGEERTITIRRNAI